MGNYDVIVIGAGISGATIAERFASERNKKVLVFEKRDHIGGNCYDFLDKHGLLISKYGAHIFHTSFEDVWEYINKFSSWTPYTHKVLSFVDGRLVPVPVNITTVNALLGLSITSESQMHAWLATQKLHIPSPKNSEESALSRVGPLLYEKMFKKYTLKQWDIDPSQLDPSVLDRIPVRENYEDRYFTDPHQAMPSKGYTKLFEKMLSHKNIEVRLSTDYFDVKEQLSRGALIFFTGPIDRFFDYKFGEKLQYRSLRFVFETHDKQYFQQNSVINFPNDHAYTRIVEYKYLYQQDHPKTTISKEFPTWEGEPYYPVPSQRNKNLYAKYQAEAEKLEKKGIYFVGRLATYKYFNMDQAFKSALDLYKRVSTTQH